MGFFLQGGLALGFGKNKQEYTSDGTTTSRDTKLSAFGVGISPGIVIFVSKKVALEMNFGQLNFTSSSSKYTDNSVEYKYSSSNFNWEINPSYFTAGVAVHLN
jgi:hypothetical protein